MSNSLRGEPFAPVFIVGCPRSGTTLLQRLLDAHSHVAIAPETHFIRRLWLDRSKRGDLNEDVVFEYLVGEVLALPEVLDMRLDRDAFRESARQIDRTYSALFALLLCQYAKGRHATVVGEKTPNHLLYMDILHGFFPAARFIHIVRDPRAVVNSWRTVPWSTGSIQGDTRVWARYIRTARSQGLPAGSVMTLTYEALISKPESTLRRICTFLQLPFEPGMLLFYEKASDTVDVTREPWKADTSRRLSDQAISGWRDTLSGDDVQTVERLAWREMLIFGYRPSMVRLLWVKAISILRTRWRGATRLLKKIDHS
jgi:hypothetical protein